MHLFLSINNVLSFEDALEKIERAKFLIQWLCSFTQDDLWRSKMRAEILERTQKLHVFEVFFVSGSTWAEKSL